MTTENETNASLTDTMVDEVKKGKMIDVQLNHFTFMWQWQEGSHGVVFMNNDDNSKFIRLNYESAVCNIKALGTMLYDDAETIIQFIMDCLSMAYATAKHVYDTIVSMVKRDSKEDA